MAAEERRPGRIGIALQLDLVVVLVVLAMGGSLGAIFVREVAEHMELALAARIRVLGSFLATAAEERWERGSEADLDAILSATALDPEVAYVLLKDLDGQVRAARWSDATRGPVLEHAFAVHARPTAPAAEPFGEVHAPDAPVVGAIAIGVARAPLAQERRDLVWRTVAATVLSAVAAAVLGHVLVALLLRGPFARLQAGLRALAAGDLGHRMHLDVRTTEVAEMGQAADDMAERLSQTLVTKAALEERVATRTRELTEAVELGLQIQEALLEREEHVRLLLESTAEAIYGMDLEGRCTFANPACARLLGFPSADTLVGQNMHRLIHHSRADGTIVPESGCAIGAALRDGREYHAVDETYWRADGKPLVAECWSYPVHRDGRLIGSVVTFLDVTERRRIEDELHNMKKLESLGVLAGGIAHDFNNMLTGILGNLSLARESVPAGEELAELLAEAEEAAKRARALTQQLLTFSKGGAPVKRPLQPREVVEDAATFALRGTAVRPSFTGGDGLWAVEADPGQLAQVIQNLVINSAQAMPKGGTIEVACANVQLGAEAAVPLPPGPYVRISVHDDGVGIPPEHLPRIFDPYFTTKQHGSGLGLATVYAIVKKHGGHVSVSSRVGGGTTFDVWLPATGRAAAAEAARTPRLAPPRGARVLVMDDEALVRTAAAAMLRSLGLEVVEACDGADALAAFEAARAAGRPIAAVLMDLTVPGGMGGVEAVRRLRAIDGVVPVLATSGYSNDPVLAAPQDWGFSGVLPKPYTVEDLSRTLAEVLPPGRASASA